MWKIPVQMRAIAAAARTAPLARNGSDIERCSWDLKGILTILSSEGKFFLTGTEEFARCC